MTKHPTAARIAFFLPKKSLRRAKIIRKPEYVRRYESTTQDAWSNWPKADDIVTSVVATIDASKDDRSNANARLPR